MVWASLMHDGRTPLHIFERGSVTSQHYCRENILDNVRIFRDALGLDFQFMDDSVYIYRSDVVSDTLKSNSTIGNQEPISSLPISTTSREDLRPNGYLEYPNAVKALYIYKRPCLVPGFKPRPYGTTGYVKSLVYADTPQRLDHLEDNIRRVIADIRPQMLESHRKLDVQIGLHPSQPLQSYARNHI
ncbi:hypothetical protein TNCV_1599911 [Trichonephila clavipes]|nr:hypothetical protein TNCV_1599911 [Trichonephila clavipes]